MIESFKEAGFGYVHGFSWPPSIVDVVVTLQVSFRAEGGFPE